MHTSNYKQLQLQEYYRQNMSIKRVPRRFLKYLAVKYDGLYQEQGIYSEILCDRFNVKSPEMQKCSD